MAVVMVAAAIVMVAEFITMFGNQFNGVRSLLITCRAMQLSSTYRICSFEVVGEIQKFRRQTPV